MPSPRLVLTHGARDAETQVLDALDALAAEARRAPRLLGAPVRVVVPSISLREHLTAALIRRGASAGCEITTLSRFAMIALERAELARAEGRGGDLGSATPLDAGPLFEILVRRLARHADALRGPLDSLDDGYGLVVASVHDLLDAGFEKAHAEPLRELLASDAGRIATAAQIERAEALVDIAAAVTEGFAEHGLAHRAALLRAARDAIELSGRALLPTRALLVHGFADATGVVADLLETLLRVFDGRLILDHPAIPGGQAADGGGDSDGGFESTFPERLRQRLSQLCPTEEIPATGKAATGGATTVELLEAADRDSELSRLARRLRRRLDNGAVPERLAVVARDPAVVRRALRRRFTEFGIPFSGASSHGPSSHGPRSPLGRDLGLLVELLRRGDELPVDRWLEGRRDLVDPAARTELRHRLLALGAGRLGDLARRAQTPIAPSDPPRPAEQALADAARRAAELHRRLADWRGEQPADTPPLERPLAEHARRLSELLEQDLGWDGAHPARRALAGALAPRLRDLGPVGLTWDEMTLVVGRLVEDLGYEPLGGRGGGVQILSVMEARGRTFDHLTVCALERDVFPRSLREDSLLPDPLRRLLRRLLPDLPIKSDGRDEERYLFAQLLSTAPEVLLSWSRQDASGRDLAPSPLLDRLRRDHPPSSAPFDESGADRTPTPLADALRRRALAGREGFSELWPTALAAARAPLAGAASEIDLRRLADARLRVLGEIEPGRRIAELGPYFGFVGPPRHPGDRRRRPPAVTVLENLAVCPWQSFLQRVLRLQPPADPLASLPALRGRVLGNLVHRVLEGIAAPPSAWPDAEELDVRLRQAAEETLRDHGLDAPGLARAAAEQARPYLEVARRLDWTPAAPEVEAVEHRGVLRLPPPGGPDPGETVFHETVFHQTGFRELTFRADRVDRIEDGEGPIRVLTDYKTGAPSKELFSKRSGRRALADAVGRGEYLQAPAYARGGGPGARGRFLYLRPDLDDAQRVVEVTAEEGEIHQRFDDAADILFDAWEIGLFIPRLVEPDDDVEPRRCDYCDVAEACLRRDSGARRRLWSWAEQLETEEDGTQGDDGSRLEQALVRLWKIRSKKPKRNPAGP